MQHTHGQGLAGAINGGVGGANNARLTPADQMLAKVTHTIQPRYDSSRRRPRRLTQEIKDKIGFCLKKNAVKIYVYKRQRCDS